mgnify:CR=1 FL=1
MFSRTNTSVKAALYGLVLIIFYLLQSVPALSLRFMNVSPELLLVLAICVAYNESETFAAFFGLIVGIINDTVTDGVVGKSALFFMFASFMVAVLLKTVLRRLFLTYVVIELCAIALFLIVEYVLILVFFGNMPLSLCLAKVILPKFLFSAALCYPVYYVIRFLNRKLDAGGVEL